MHAYFERDYRPNPREQGHDPLPDMTLSNADGFYNGLPPSRSKSRRGCGTVLNNRERQQQREAKLRAQINTLENRLSRQR